MRFLSSSVLKRFNFGFIRIGLIIFLMAHQIAVSQTTIKTECRQKLASWMYFAESNQTTWNTGMMAIPQLQFSKHRPSGLLIDSEFSVKLMGSKLQIDQQNTFNGVLEPYRAWVRLSSNQFEFRLGLQKINFGSANSIRPLMWFDKLDPRDPLQLTPGTWAALFRYYFMNNANLWVWSILDREPSQGWYYFSDKALFPELGSRFQMPVKKGEIALSYNFREGKKNETFRHQHLFGFDAKFNYLVSFWIEGTHEYVPMTLSERPMTIDLWNLGVDYTFGLGSGLLVSYEMIYYADQERLPGIKNQSFLSLVTASTSITPFDRVFGLIYWAHTSNTVFPFLTYQHQFDTWSANIMAYWNPQNAAIPSMSNDYNSFLGKGIQLMIIYDLSVEPKSKTKDNVN